MLVKFLVSNVLSFNELQEFSMYANKKIPQMAERNFHFNDKQILKLSAIFGANASGKTNFIKSLSLMKSCVASKEARSAYTDWYYAFSESDKPSYLEVGIIVNNKMYGYGFEIVLSSGKIVNEWLYEIIDKEEKMIYEINKDREISYGELSKSVEEKIKGSYESDFKQSNDLLMTFLNKEKPSFIDVEGSKVITDVYKWFTDTLNIITPNDNIAWNLFSDQENVSKLETLLNDFDTGIKKIKCSDIDENQLKEETNNEIFTKLKTKLETVKNKHWKYYCDSGKPFTLVISKKVFLIGFNENKEYSIKQLTFYHDENETKPFSYIHESDGTRRLIQLASILLYEKNDKVFLVDELERCFHPHLTYEFVKTFANKNRKTNNQLIISTHEQYIMNQDLFRRDEIWFCNKIENATELYSLSQFNIRNDKIITNDYNIGRYGAIPYIKRLVDYYDTCGGKLK